MKHKLLALLVCPQCGGDLECLGAGMEGSAEIESAELHCLQCRCMYPVVRGIPRFVRGDEYAASFGLQWNTFRREQLDSDNGAELSRRRFFSETGLKECDLAGLNVVEAGCGAGRFLEVVSTCGCEVVGVDISSAVEAAAETVRNHPNAHVVQASIMAMPFKAGAFDLCYSIGVLQHTPDPRAAAAALPRYVRPRGRIAVTVYERKPWTLFNGKYLVRPLTTRLPPALLLGMVKLAVTLLFPFTDLLFRVPVLGRAFSFVIPVCDYSDIKGLSWMQRYRAVVLDTFDMLSPAYDAPMTRPELEGALSSAGVREIRRLPEPGLNLVGLKT